MNKNRLLKLANVLERDSGKHGLGFNMSSYLTAQEPDKSGRGCGTVACIAGWACFLFDDDGKVRPTLEASQDAIATASDNPRNLDQRDIRDRASRVLELEDSLARALFVPSPTLAYLASPAKAAKTVRHLANTGEVDWTVAF